jgi:hypothetical protein
MKRNADPLVAQPPPDAPQPEDWVRDELEYARVMAQAVADQAYDDWCLLGGAERYAAYRAAQDRADAAQDELARWARAMNRLRGDLDR